jgi:hypothetical protein
VTGTVGSDVIASISPELTKEKVGTITTIAESPLDAAVLYAGTDDGNIAMAFLFLTPLPPLGFCNGSSTGPNLVGRKWHDLEAISVVLPRRPVDLQIRRMAFEEVQNYPIVGFASENDADQRVVDPKKVTIQFHRGATSLWNTEESEFVLIAPTI